MEEEQSIQTILTFQSAMQPATVSAFRAYTLAIFLFSIRSYEASTISSVTLLNGGWFCGASGGCKIKISGTGFGNEFDRPSTRFNRIQSRRIMVLLKAEIHYTSMDSDF